MGQGAGTVDTMNILCGVGYGSARTASLRLPLLLLLYV